MIQRDHTIGTVLQSERAMLYRRATPRAQIQASQSQIVVLITFASEQGFSKELIHVFEDVGASVKRLPANDLTVPVPNLAALFRLRCKQAAHSIAEQIGNLSQCCRLPKQAEQNRAEEQQS